MQSVTDGQGNKTSYVYDGQDRLSQTQYPSGTKGAGTSNSADYEQLGYDAGGNVTSRRLRDGSSIGYTYDALGRLTFKDLPGSDPDVTYTYDLLGRMTGAAQTGTSLAFGYDALGRKVSETNPFGTYSSAYDVAGRRTRLTHPDGFYVDQDYLVTGEMVHIRENGASSGVGVLATYAYDDLGRRTSVTYGDGSTTSYSYDGASRLTQQVLDLAGTASDLTLGFTYNPAGQIVTNTRSNDTYAWNGHYNVNRGYTANGLNQYSAVASLTPAYDARGNLTSDGTTTMGYDSENRMTLAPSGIHAFYDPLGRMSGVGTTAPAAYYESEGALNVAERTGAGAVGRRHVFGPGGDEPVVWYEGSGTSDRRFYHQDERGSTVALTDGSGNVLSTTVYDEYGAPRTTSSTYTARFLYTGQRYFSAFGLYYYKARMYSPTWGRFMQTDPIGYGAGTNMYGYAGGDPINRADPSGLTPVDAGCTGTRLCRQDGSGSASFGSAAVFGDFGGGRGSGGATTDIVEVNEYDVNDLSTPLDTWWEVRSGGLTLASWTTGDFANNECRGQYSCEDSPNAEMVAVLRALAHNNIFLSAVKTIINLSNRDHDEWGFTGRGFANFRLIGGYLHGGGDAISADAIAARAAMGADVFIHTHPQVDDVHAPWLSEGFQNALEGGDLGVAYRNHMFIGAFGYQTKKWYWYDGRVGH